MVRFAFVNPLANRHNFDLGENVEGYSAGKAGEVTVMARNGALGCLFICLVACLFLFTIKRKFATLLLRFLLSTVCLVVLDTFLKYCGFLILLL